MTQILLTNDDGYQSPGLLALKQALTPVGQTTVFAPDHNWSAAGHTKTMHKPLRVRQVTLVDGTPATIRVLRPIADAVGDQVEITLDGGIRRGSDVVKALALGARAVLIGRAYLWGLAANGQAGVENVLDILRSGIDSALLGLGLTGIDELRPDHVVVPDGFHRVLGA